MAGREGEGVEVFVAFGDGDAAGGEEGLEGGEVAGADGVVEGA